MAFTHRPSFLSGARLSYLLLLILNATPPVAAQNDSPLCVSTPGTNLALLSACEALASQVSSELTAGGTVVLSTNVEYSITTTGTNSRGFPTAGLTTVPTVTSAVGTSSSNALGILQSATLSASSFGAPGVNSFGQTTNAAQASSAASAASESANAGGIVGGSGGSTSGFSNGANSASGTNNAASGSQSTGAGATGSNAATTTSGAAGAGGASSTATTGGAAGAQSSTGSLSQNSNNNSAHNYRDHVVIPVAVVCTVVPVIAILLCICFCLARRRKKRRSSPKTTAEAAALVGGASGYGAGHKAAEAGYGNRHGNNMMSDHTPNGTGSGYSTATPNGVSTGAGHTAGAGGHHVGQTAALGAGALGAGALGAGAYAHHEKTHDPYHSTAGLHHEPEKGHGVSPGMSHGAATGDYGAGIGSGHPGHHGAAETAALGAGALGAGGLAHHHHQQQQQHHQQQQQQHQQEDLRPAPLQPQRHQQLQQHQQMQQQPQSQQSSLTPPTASQSPAYGQSHGGHHAAEGAALGAGALGAGGLAHHNHVQQQQAQQQQRLQEQQQQQRLMLQQQQQQQQSQAQHMRPGSATRNIPEIKADQASRPATAARSGFTHGAGQSEGVGGQAPTHGGLGTGEAAALGAGAVGAGALGAGMAKTMSHNSSNYSTSQAGYEERSSTEAASMGTGTNARNLQYSTQDYSDIGNPHAPATNDERLSSQTRGVSGASYNRASSEAAPAASTAGPSLTSRVAGYFTPRSRQRVHSGADSEERPSTVTSDQPPTLPEVDPGMSSGSWFAGSDDLGSDDAARRDSDLVATSADMSTPGDFRSIADTGTPHDAFVTPSEGRTEDGHASDDSQYSDLLTPHGNVDGGGIYDHRESDAYGAMPARVVQGPHARHFAGAPSTLNTAVPVAAVPVSTPVIHHHSTPSQTAVLASGSTPSPDSALAHEPTNSTSWWRPSRVVGQVQPGRYGGTSPTSGDDDDEAATPVRGPRRVPGAFVYPTEEEASGFNFSSEEREKRSSIPRKPIGGTGGAGHGNAM